MHSTVRQPQLRRVQVVVDLGIAGQVPHPSLRATRPERPVCLVGRRSGSRVAHGVVTQEMADLVQQPEPQLLDLDAGEHDGIDVHVPAAIDRKRAQIDPALRLVG